MKVSFRESELEKLTKELDEYTAIKELAFSKKEKMVPHLIEEMFEARKKLAKKAATHIMELMCYAAWMGKSTTIINGADLKKEFHCFDVELCKNFLEEKGFIVKGLDENFKRSYNGTVYVSLPIDEKDQCND